MRCRRRHLLLLASLATGCSARTGGAPDRGARPSSDAMALVTIKAGTTGLLFSFFDQRAELRTVEQAKQVLDSARAQVLVTRPGHPLPGDLIFVSDLRKPQKDGKYRVWVERRGAWMDRVMPHMSRLSRPLVARAAKRDKGARRPRRTRKKVRPAAAAAAAATGAQPRVLLFSTAWCPSCKAARAHLTAKGVRFLELDVENNQQAAALYQQLAAAHGLKAGAVPVIVVDGRPLQGFSAPQLDALLAASGLASR